IFKHLLLGRIYFIYPRHGKDDFFVSHIRSCVVVFLPANLVNLPLICKFALSPCRRLLCAIAWAPTTLPSPDSALPFSLMKKVSKKTKAGKSRSQVDCKAHLARIAAAAFPQSARLLPARAS